MPAFSDRSLRELATCDPRLQAVFRAVIRHFDCTILVGHRDQAAQDEVFRRGLSKLRFPQSKHNQSPSLAVDVAPSPINWEDLDRFRYFAGFVVGTAAAMGITLRWGGDWDRDTETRDNRFNDLPHFELVDED